MFFINLDYKVRLATLEIVVKLIKILVTKNNKHLIQIILLKK